MLLFHALLYSHNHTVLDLGCSQPALLFFPSFQDVCDADFTTRSTPALGTAGSATSPSQTVKKQTQMQSSPDLPTVNYLI